MKINRWLLWVGTILLGFVVCVGLVPTQTGALLAYLILGWLFYLVRVIPKLILSPGGTITVLLCLAGLGFGLHRFLTWLRQQRARRQSLTPWEASWPWRWTLAMLGVVLLVFVAGIAAVSVTHQTAWLVTSREPLFEGTSIRIAIERAQSQNNLKQIGIALTNYAAANEGQFPSMTLDKQGTLLHSWQTQLLPFLEHEELYRRIMHNRPWSDPAQGAVFQERMRGYLHPIGDLPLQVEGYAASHYAGNVHLFGRDTRVPVQRLAAGAGLSNTILAGEVAEGVRPWGDPANLRDPGKGLNRSPAGFGSPMPQWNPTQFIMADGGVRFFKNDSDPEFLEMLGKPDR